MTGWSGWNALRGALLAAYPGPPQFAMLLATFEENLRQTSSVRRVVPPELCHQIVTRQTFLSPCPGHWFLVLSLCFCRSTTGVCEKTLFRRSKHANALASKTPDQGLESSFYCWTAGQGLAQKECLCHGHRQARNNIYIYIYTHIIFLLLVVVVVLLSLSLLSYYIYIHIIYMFTVTARGKAVG